MAIVAAKCTQCGAILNVDSSKDAGICEYCGTPFIVEKAINLFSINTPIGSNLYEADFEICAGTLIAYRGSNSNVIVPNGVTVIGAKVFSDMAALETVTLPDTVIEIQASAFASCKRLNRVILPNGLEEIGGDAFNGCSALDDITLPDRIKIIKDNTFKNCKNLTKIIISNSTTCIRSYAFAGCTNLKKITLPPSITKIDRGAFSDCSSLIDVELPPKLSAIERYTFSGCNKLKHVTIPENVSLIEGYAFGNCLELGDILLKNDSLRISPLAFDGCCFSREYCVDLERRFGKLFKTKTFDELQKSWCRENRCGYCGGRIKGGSFTEAHCLRCGRRGTRKHLLGPCLQWGDMEESFEYQNLR